MVQGTLINATESSRGTASPVAGGRPQATNSTATRPAGAGNPLASNLDTLNKTSQQRSEGSDLAGLGVMLRAQQNLIQPNLNPTDMKRLAGYPGA
jgi:hypothetical protein